MRFLCHLQCLWLGETVQRFLCHLQYLWEVRCYWGFFVIFSAYHQVRPCWGLSPVSVIMLPFIYAVSLGYRFEIETGFIMFCFTFVLTCNTGKVARERWSVSQGQPTCHSVSGLPSIASDTVLVLAWSVTAHSVSWESPHTILSVDSPALPLTLFWC